MPRTPARSQRLRAGTRPHYADFLRSRPPATEDVAIEQVIGAARRTGCRVHIVHLSSAESVPALGRGPRRRSADLGGDLPALPRDHGRGGADGQTQYKCCPPVREAANQELLWQALADGVIDIVVSDHSPSIPAMKLFETWRLLLGLGWDLVAAGELPRGLDRGEPAGFDLEQVVAWMATRTAELMGVDGKGRIARRWRCRSRRVRARGHVRRRPGHAAAPSPGDSVRRTHPQRCRPLHLSARRPRRGHAARTSDRTRLIHDQRGPMMSSYATPPGGSAAADPADDQPRQVHRGVRGVAARHDDRHRHQLSAVLGRHPALGDRPAADGLLRDVLAVHRRGVCRAGAATGPRPTRPRRRCCSSSTVH